MDLKQLCDGIWYLPHSQATDRPALGYIRGEQDSLMVDCGNSPAHLAQFRRDGTIQVIGNVDGEERYDADLSPHSHFVCRTCGKVADLPFSEVNMPDTSGVGKMESCSVTFYGCCNDCL